MHVAQSTRISSAGCFVQVPRVSFSNMKFYFWEIVEFPFSKKSPWSSAYGTTSQRPHLHLSLHRRGVIARSTVQH